MTRLEHIGIAVQDVEAVRRLYHDLFGWQPYKTEEVLREGVRTHFLPAGTAKLELLEALEAASPVARFLEKRGEGLHHLAFEVEDLDATFARLQALGYRLLGDAPRTGADGKRIFFLHPGQTHGVLVECCESTPTPLVRMRLPGLVPPLALIHAGDATRPLLVWPTRDDVSAEPLIRRLEPFFHVMAGDCLERLPDVLASYASPPPAAATVFLTEPHKTPLPALPVNTRLAVWFDHAHPALPDTGLLLALASRTDLLPAAIRHRPGTTCAVLPDFGTGLLEADLLVPLLRHWTYRTTTAA